MHGDGAQARPAVAAEGAFEAFCGADAYAFMLRFACGLESKLAAETEIFGQIKSAWGQFESHDSPLVHELSPWIQLLFQDVKAIRSHYLANLGSTTYGSQVRRLLDDEHPVAGTPSSSGPTLLIGAGQLAQSVAPYLKGSELWLANRTGERANALARKLLSRCARPVRVLESAEAELRAWSLASNVVLCVPPDAERDSARLDAWRAGADRRPSGRIIHLGLGAEIPEPWSGLQGLVALDGLFDMLRAHSDLRTHQLQRARRACTEKAMLRTLDCGGSHSQSWEDLAVFETL